MILQKMHAASWTIGVAIVVVLVWISLVFRHFNRWRVVKEGKGRDQMGRDIISEGRVTVNYYSGTEPPIDDIIGSGLDNLILNQQGNECCSSSVISAFICPCRSQCMCLHLCELAFIGTTAENELISLGNTSIWMLMPEYLNFLKHIWVFYYCFSISTVVSLFIHRSHPIH